MQVPSFSDSSKTYDVTATSCTCLAKVYRPDAQCKHQRAVIAEFQRATLFRALQKRFDYRHNSDTQEAHTTMATKKTTKPTTKVTTPVKPPVRDSEPLAPEAAPDPVQAPVSLRQTIPIPRQEITLSERSDVTS